MTAGEFKAVPWMAGMTDDEGAYRAHSFFNDMRGVREFEENYEKYGPMMFGLHDGQSEAPKVIVYYVEEFTHWLWSVMVNIAALTGAHITGPNFVATGKVCHR